MKHRIALLMVMCLAHGSTGWAAPGTRHVDAKNGFSIQSPQGWGPAPVSGRLVWHAASSDGTQMPDCSVIVTQDVSFAALSADDFIEGQTQDALVQALSLGFADVKLGVWEPNHRMGGQRALHVVYAGTLDGQRQMSLMSQTIRDGRLYTFACNAEARAFPGLYAELLHIMDTFEFVPISPA